MTTIATAPPAAVVFARRYTPDDVTAMEEHGLYELVDGQLTEKRMAADATAVVGQVTGRLWMHAHLTRSGGDIMPEQSYECFPDNPGQVRRPDVSYVAAGRMPSPRPPGHLRFRPDVAVEVVSPTDNAYELQEKLDDYRAVSIPLVWVVWPHLRLVQQHTPGNPIVEFRPGDTLTGGDVLPGFAVAVDDLFLPPSPPPGGGQDV